jgi:hypothetical protein
MSAGVADYVAEVLTLCSALAVVYPALRFTKVQEHATRLAAIIAKAESRNDDVTAELARETAKAKAERADKFYGLDKFLLLLGIALAAFASLIKIFIVLPGT